MSRLRAAGGLIVAMVVLISLSVGVLLHLERRQDTQQAAHLVTEELQSFQTYAGGAERSGQVFVSDQHLVESYLAARKPAEGTQLLAVMANGSVVSGHRHETTPPELAVRVAEASADRSEGVLEEGSGIFQWRRVALVSGGGGTAGTFVAAVRTPGPLEAGGLWSLALPVGMLLVATPLAWWSTGVIARRLRTVRSGAAPQAV